MIHIHTLVDGYFSVRVLCGAERRAVGHTLLDTDATDKPIASPTGDDLRCPECWRVWKERRRELARLEVTCE